MIVDGTFESASSSEQLVFQISEKRKKVNWYSDSIIFYIVCITIVNKSRENKITFQEYFISHMSQFLDWLCTIKEVCTVSRCKVFKERVVEKCSYIRTFFSKLNTCFFG